MREEVLGVKDNFTLTQDVELKIKKIRGNLRFVKGNVKVVAFARNKHRDLLLQIPFKFGQTLAQTGKSVIIVDLEPNISKNIVHNIKESYTLIHYIRGLVNFNDIRYSTDIFNMDYIPSGIWNDDECFIPSLDLYTNLIDSLSHEYDYILLNVPSLDNMLNAPLALSLCDSAVVLLGEGEHAKESQAYWKRYVELACVTYLGYIEEK